MAGGGTAGHINPALAIAGYIKARQPDSAFLFIGTKGGMECTLVPKAGFDLACVQVSGIRRTLTPGNLKAVLQAAAAYRKCRGLVRDFKPDVAVGTGGYVSGPAIAAAARLGVPTLIHEQNVFAGMTSRLLSGMVDTVCISFEGSRSRFPKAKKVVLTGNPLRSELFAYTPAEARRRLKVGGKPFILAFGGSLGAQQLNAAVVRFIKAHPDGYQMLFGTGARDYEAVQAQLQGCGMRPVQVVPYIYNMHEALAAADLVIGRAGAITVCELNALGKPAVLIPSPNVTDNHQYFNAKALADEGAAVLVEEGSDDYARFDEIVSGLIESPERLSEMGVCSMRMGIKNGAELIYNELKALLNLGGLQ